VIPCVRRTDTGSQALLAGMLVITHPIPRWLKLLPMPGPMARARLLYPEPDPLVCITSGWPPWYNVHHYSVTHMLVMISDGRCPNRWQVHSVPDLLGGFALGGLLLWGFMAGGEAVQGWMMSHPLGGLALLASAFVLTAAHPTPAKVGKPGEGMVVVAGGVVVMMMMMIMVVVVVVVTMMK
jgi:hypothetical protein